MRMNRTVAATTPRMLRSLVVLAALSRRAAALSLVGSAPSEKAHAADGAMTGRDALEASLRQTQEHVAAEESLAAPSRSADAISIVGSASSEKAHAAVGAVTGRDTLKASLRHTQQPVAAGESLERSQVPLDYSNAIPVAETDTLGEGVMGQTDGAIRYYPPGHPYANMKRLKIMGTFDSGTNFISNLLSVNLEAGLPDNGFVGRSVQYPPSCDRFLPGINPERSRTNHVEVVTPAPQLCDDTWYGSGIHKHNLPSGRWVDLLMRETNTVVVAMVRSPIAHLDALRKAPYNLGPRFFQAHPDSPCQLSARDEVVWDDAGNTIDQNFTSGADFVQQFIKRFAHYRDSAHAKVVMVAYEEAVLQPEKVIRRVFEALGFEQYTPSPIIPYEEPAKNHGNAIGTTEARDMILQRDYLKDPNLTDYIKASCAQLDREFLEQFIVPTEPPRTFYSDCQEVQQAE